MTQQQAEAETAKSELLRLVNAHRASLGVGLLVRADALEEPVQRHVDDMADGTQSFGHAGMSGRCSQARSELGGGNACGEVVARYQKTPAVVMASWLGSSGHRAQIEKGRYTRVGLGQAIDREGKPYWALLFLEI